jgi:hypothetical protein
LQSTAVFPSWQPESRGTDHSTKENAALPGQIDLKFTDHGSQDPGNEARYFGMDRGHSTAWNHRTEILALIELSVARHLDNFH